MIFNARLCYALENLFDTYYFLRELFLTIIYKRSDKLATFDTFFFIR